MSRVFIGFTGVKQAGKTTSFQFLKEAFPGVREIALADKLKNECSKVFGIERSYFDDQAKKEVDLDVPVYLNEENLSQVIQGFGFTPEYNRDIRPHISTILHTPRQVAQYIGTEVLRNIDTDVHCAGTVKDLPETGVFVITDIRFPNEYEFFSKRESNFYPFYIQNERAEAVAKLDTHASERYILDIAKNCERINNNGTLDALKTEILSKVGTVLEGSNRRSRE